MVCDLQAEPQISFYLCVLMLIVPAAPSHRGQGKKIHPGMTFSTTDRGKGAAGGRQVQAQGEEEGRRGKAEGHKEGRLAAHRLLVINTQLHQITEESSLGDPRRRHTEQHIIRQSCKFSFLAASPKRF